MKRVAILHEMEPTGRHRIVVIRDDGTNSVGDWFPNSEVAHHEGLFANANPDNGLPAGVFTVREVPHQVLA